jgi:HlyD family secretion protein/macrolide-specific efflux system membrane fusion protein
VNTFVRRAGLIVAIALLSSAAGWVARGCQQSSAGRSTGDPRQLTVRVQRGRIQQAVKARGIVKPAPNASVRVGFPMPGDVSRRIRTMHVVEGDVVTEGTLLAELEATDLLEMLAQLEADGAVLQKRLDALHALQPQEMRVAQSVRDQAAAEAELAKSKLERAAQLRGTIVSLQDYESARSAAQVGQARLANAEATLDRTRTRFETEIATVRAQLEQANAAIRGIGVQLEWSTLRAPFNGVVFAVHQRPGELTSNQPNAPVLTLLRANQLQLHAYVDEADFGQVQTGQEVTVHVEAHTSEPLKGTVARVLPQPILQENVVYYLAVVEIDESKRALLRPEMTGLAYIQVGQNERVLWLPPAAVQSGPQGWYVRRVTSSGPVEVPVRIGTRSDGQVEVREGLREGDDVLLK